MKKLFYTHKSDQLIDLEAESDILKTDWSKWSSLHYQEGVIYHEIYTRRDYFRGECVVKPFDTVIDVGANVGIFTSLALDMGATRVISFEPDENNYDLAKKNNPNAEIYQMAVSDKTGETELFFTEGIGGHSIVKQLWDDRPDHYRSSGFKVKTITLDDIINIRSLDKIDFIKIDCEGAELDVLKGVSDYNLINKVKNISVEYHHVAFNHDEQIYTDFQQRFLSFGFNVFTQILDDNYRMVYISRGDVFN